MELRFPPLNGGSVTGLNDAGVETFEGDFATSIIRECAQNSLDAAASDEAPVVLAIQWFVFKDDALPFKPALRKAFEACVRYWPGQDKALRFFKRALEILEKPHLDVLKVSDHGTRGVGGEDHDKNGAWFGLVKSRGVSNKNSPGSQGAFGIGKDAPLAGSPLRTVLYSTKTENGDPAFQGVVRLVTHEGGDGKETQGTGFIGDFDPARMLHKALRDLRAIPAQFHRAEPGLDLWILGYKNLQRDWQKPFIWSALANFWPGIWDGKVVFKIGDLEISKGNLAALMEAERSASVLVQDAYPYFQSLVDAAAVLVSKKDVPTAGACRLRLLVGKQGLPKKICMVRKTGMVIDYYTPRVGLIPFSGLFSCDDPDGNEILKFLEPPRHDKFDPKRAETPEQKRILDNIKQWVREELIKLLPKAGSTDINETNVPRELLDIEPGEPPEPGKEPEEEDIIGVAGKVSDPIPVRPPVRAAVQARATTASGRGGSGRNRGGGGTTTGPGPGPGKTEGGTGGGDASDVIITSRFFRSSGAGKEVTVILRSDSPFQGDVRILLMGEDGTTQPVRIESCTDGKGRKAGFSGSEITSLKILPGQPETYRIQIREVIEGGLVAEGILLK